MTDTCDLRSPEFAKEKYHMDIDAFLTLIQCCNRCDDEEDSKKIGSITQMPDENEAYVENKVAQLVRDGAMEQREVEAIDNIARICVKIKQGHGHGKKKWSRKPRVLLGNKYEKRDPDDRIPRTWIVIDAQERRLVIAMGHLPYVLTTRMDICDVWILCEDGRFAPIKERKTHADLRQSTHSKHKDRQIARMLLSGIQPSQMQWWIEEPTKALMCPKCSKNRPETYYVETQSSSANLRCRDGFVVMETTSIFDTMVKVLREAQSIMEYGFPANTLLRCDKGEEIPHFEQANVGDHVRTTLNWIQQLRGPEFLETPEAQRRALVAARKPIKKNGAGLRPKDFRDGDGDDLGMFLVQCHGVDKKANAIAAKYKTIRGLTEAYRALDKEETQDVNEIKEETHDKMKKEPVDEELVRDEELVKDDDGTRKKRKRLIQLHSSDDEFKDESSTKDSKKKKKKTKSKNLDDATTEDDVDDEWVEDEKKPKKPRKKRTPRKKKTDGGDPRIRRLALMLENIETESGPVGGAVSRTIWRHFYALPGEKEIWKTHPANIWEVARLRNLAKKEKAQKEQGNGKEEPNETNGEPQERDEEPQERDDVHEEDGQGDEVE